MTTPSINYHKGLSIFIFITNAQLYLLFLLPKWIYDNPKY
nr:MAG TPA: hypothetical protein [Caudoviricetes sp.]